jgi:AbrB family looped-hinge helix DNA binding protein
MKTTISSNGQIVVPAEIRSQDDLRTGEEFEIERLGRGEYLLRRTRKRRNEGLLRLLLACPMKDWFQAADRNETTSESPPPTFR